jgi:gluconokinase
MGVAGSGKTSVARALADELGFVFLDADDFHEPAARTRMAAGTALTDAEREPWVEALAAALRRHADAGRSTVLAFSGLRARHRQRLRDCGVPMRFVFLHAPPHVIAARLATRRGHFMPPSLFASQLEALESPQGEADVIAVAADRPLRDVVAAVIGAGV